MLKQSTTALLVVSILIGFIALAATLFVLITRTSSDLELDGEIGDVIDSSDDGLNYSAGDKEREYWVTNPTSGSDLFVMVIEPTNSTSEKLPALVFVPGGQGASDDFLTQRRDAQKTADEGFIVVLFDPEGRGQSKGEEDNNGTIGQDGLNAVVEFTATLPSVDAEQVGIASFSYGITMASGMLSRYHDTTSAKYLIDWEGPSDRTETAGCGGEEIVGQLTGLSSCDDEEFWGQREALTFIADVRVPYQRLQTKKDHVQPGYEHTVKMVNAAVNGAAPWVRLNDSEPNEFFTQVSVVPLPEVVDRDLMTVVANYAKELIALTL